MSAVRRILSGSAASWAGMGVGLLSQVLTIPVLLSFWSAEELGVWLTAQAAMVLLLALDSGHQNYLAYEFINKAREPEFGVILGSGIPVAVGLVALEFVICLGLITSGVTACCPV